MIEIIQGEKQPYTIRLTSKKNDGQPFDLTGNTEIVVCFKASTLIEKKKTLAEVAVVGDPLLGTISGDLLVADTNALTPLQSGPIEVTVTFGAGDVRKAQILDGFKVIEKICTT